MIFGNVAVPSMFVIINTAEKASIETNFLSCIPQASLIIENSDIFGWMAFFIQWAYTFYISSPNIQHKNMEWKYIRFIKQCQ